MIANFVSQIFVVPFFIVNMKLDTSGCNRAIFPGCSLHWSGSFQMAKTKWAMLALMYYAEFVKNPPDKVRA